MNIVVNITRAATITQLSSFGTALLITNTLKPYKEYANIEEVLVDFASTTKEYKFAAAYFGQEITPTKLAIAGVVYTEETAVVAGVFTLDSGLIYDFPNQNIVVGSLANLTDDGGVIPESQIVSIDYPNGKITVNAPLVDVITGDFDYYNPATVLTDLLSTLVNENRDFYTITTIDDGYAVQKEIDDWITAGRIKLQFGLTDVDGLLYPVTLSERSALYYHETTEEYPNGSILGNGLAKDPGSLSWNNQVVKNVTPNDLTTTELADLKTARINTVITKYGSIATEGGLLMTDLFIDQRRSQDFVKVTMENNIGVLLISEDKVPYDDLGIPLIVAEVEDALNQSFANGIIATKADGKTPDFIVNSLSRAEILATDPTAISERIIRSITFQYVEAGAIEGAVVNGQVVVAI